MEIVGPSGVGKTELLYAAALQTALPQVSSPCACHAVESYRVRTDLTVDLMRQTYDGLALGGSDGSVLFVDLDTRFSMVRFVQLLQARLRAAVDAAPNRSPNGKGEIACMNRSNPRGH